VPQKRQNDAYQALDDFLQEAVAQEALPVRA
jgi:hypothetical protein